MAQLAFFVATALLALVSAQSCPWPDPARYRNFESPAGYWSYLFGGSAPFAGYAQCPSTYYIAYNQVAVQTNDVDNLDPSTFTFYALEQNTTASYYIPGGSSPTATSCFTSGAFAGVSNVIYFWVYCENYLASCPMNVINFDYYCCPSWAPPIMNYPQAKQCACPAGEICLGDQCYHTCLSSGGCYWTFDAGCSNCICALSSSVQDTTKNVTQVDYEPVLTAELSDISAEYMQEKHKATALVRE